MSTQHEPISDRRLAELCLKGGAVRADEVEAMAWELAARRRQAAQEPKTKEPMYGQDSHG